MKREATGKILVVGSGGREHAIATKLAQSSAVTSVYVCPGNVGMESELSKIKIENIAAEDINSLLAFAKKENIDLTVVGPEAILSLGIVDLFCEHQLLIVGPTKAASLLETSKSFAKKIMKEANVPTANYREFFDLAAALDYVDSHTSERMVVKCDGLAAGKGVIVCQNKKEGTDAVNALMRNKLLGENIEHLLIEDHLEGIEVSAFALCDGNSFSFLGTACDHKRLRDNDLGPNTGGMGVFSPASIFNTEDELWINKNVFAPMISTMRRNGTPFFGILFAGLMKTKDGWKVLEFNVRFGDPETQILLPLLDEDLLPWFKASAKGEINKLQVKLNRISPARSREVGVHIVMAAHGYPGTEGIKIRSNDLINFDQDFKLGPNDYLFFAGVGKTENKFFTKGGRILGVTSISDNFTYARKNAYELIKKIHIDGAQYRTDIGSGQT